MFRVRQIVITVLAAVLACVLAYFCFMGGKSYVSELSAAGKRCAAAEAVDYSAQQEDYENARISSDNLTEQYNAMARDFENRALTDKQEESEINASLAAEADEQIAELQARIDAADAELAALAEAGRREDPQLTSDGEKDVINALNASVKDPESTDLNPLDDVCELVKWSHLTTDGDSYTCKYVGYEDGLAAMMHTLAEQLSDYDVSFGNISMRQIYNAYADTRSWDGSTLLAWYNNSFVTGTGVVARSADDLMRGRFTQAGQIADSAAAREQAMEEDKAKLDGEYAERLAAIRVTIDESIASVETSDYSDATKRGIIAQLEASYESDKQSLAGQCAAEKAAIEEKYKEQEEEEENADLSLYDLSDKNLLIYVYDITFTVRSRTN